MTIEKENKPGWPGMVLLIIGILWGLAGLVGILCAGTAVLFFDSPSPSSSANDFYLLSLISFPLVCIASSLAILFLRNKFRILAFCVSLLPVFPVILIFAGSAWMSQASCGKFDCSTPSMQQQAGQANAPACAQPAVDGGASLGTSGCGVLKPGTIVTGTTANRSEAHNWQFSAQKGSRVTITVESGATCPHISVLDPAGRVVNAFKQDNQSNMCPPGEMITTSYFYFDPPASGAYILHVITPAVPGAYWLKIN